MKRKRKAIEEALKEFRGVWISSSDPGSSSKNFWVAQHMMGIDGLLSLRWSCTDELKETFGRLKRLDL